VEAYTEAMERLLESVRGRGAKTVGLQYPVGLRTRAVDFARELEARAGIHASVFQAKIAAEGFLGIRPRTVIVDSGIIPVG